MSNVTEVLVRLDRVAVGFDPVPPPLPLEVQPAQVPEVELPIDPLVPADPAAPVP